MNPLNLNEVILYIENNIGDFHARRLQSLQGLKLKQILKRKNPYLFRAKNILTGYDLVKTLLDAHLSSQEETIFGEFLEGLAIFICGHVYGGSKSSAEGIDLELDRDGVHYIISIKSGPNWGNSRQVSKMRDDFRKAKRILGTGGNRRTVTAVNGCCYGRDAHPDKDDYLKLCGQEFWEFLSGDANFYKDIIEPLGHRAKEVNDEFARAYAEIINAFTDEFSAEFYTSTKAIDWPRLVEFNSGRQRLV
ncbi:MAG: PmeII family type II restriction endonuclease [Caldilinea sp.]